MQESSNIRSSISDKAKVEMAAKIAKDEYNKTIPAGSRMKVTREQKQINKREYNKKPEVKARRRSYDQRPHVKLKRWLKNHNEEVLRKRKEYSSREDVKLRRYIVSQRRRQLSNDCVKLLSSQTLWDSDRLKSYSVIQKRLVERVNPGTVEGGAGNQMSDENSENFVIHATKKREPGSHWQRLPFKKGTNVEGEMFDGNLHDKESSEVLKLIEEYYVRANTTSSVGGGTDNKHSNVGTTTTTKTSEVESESSSESDDDDE